MPIYPEYVTDPPPYAETRYGLIPTLQSLQSTEVVEGQPLFVRSESDQMSPERWAAGVTFAPETCAEATAWSAQCEVDEDRVKPEPDPNPEAVSQSPTEIILPFGCSSYGWQAADYEGRTNRIFLAAETKAIEHEFWTGDAGSPQSLMGSTLVDGNHILNPGGTPSSPTPVSIRRGLALGAKALANCGGGGRGMAHLEAEIGELAWQGGAIKDIETDDGDILVNGRGDAAVIGAGYTGWGPIGNPDPDGDPFDPVAPANNTGWIYFTRLVAVRATQPILMPEKFSEAFDRSTNTVVFRGESLAMAYHDGCCSFAVLVTYADL